MALPKGRNGAGPMGVRSDPCLARWSAWSLPWIPECPGTHTREISVEDAACVRRFRHL